MKKRIEVSFEISDVNSLELDSLVEYLETSLSDVENMTLWVHFENEIKTESEFSVVEKSNDPTIDSDRNEEKYDSRTV